jgi:hypothetical protein
MKLDGITISLKDVRYSPGAHFHIMSKAELYDQGLPLARIQCQHFTTR